MRFFFKYILFTSIIFLSLNNVVFANFSKNIESIQNKYNSMQNLKANFTQITRIKLINKNLKKKGGSLLSKARENAH